jgi:hypothetical protein
MGMEHTVRLAQKTSGITPLPHSYYLKYMRAREYTFNNLAALYPGCTYGKYYSFHVKLEGRRIFMEAQQEYPGDLPMDPWGPGNLEDTEDFSDETDY